MDITEMTREELESALLIQTQKAKTLKTQRDHWKRSYETSEAQLLAIGQVNLQMRNLAQQIMRTDVNGQDS